MSFKRIKVDRADTQFSLYIRTRDKWTCQKCGRYFPEGMRRGLDCAHYYSRGREATRYDEFNTLSFCTGCHSYLDGNPEEFHAFMLHRLGQAELDKLILRANTYKKRDRKMALIVANLKLKEINENNE